MFDRIHLHVGLPKTGTTALQSSLAHAESALAERGALIPRTGRKGAFAAHHVLGASLNPRRSEHGQMSKLFDALSAELAEAQAQGFRSVILSSEEFTNAISDRHSFENMRHFNHLLSKFGKVEIYLYLRPIAEFFESMLLQGIKTLRIPDFEISLPQYIQQRRFFFANLISGLVVLTRGARVSCQVFGGGLDRVDAVASFFDRINIAPPDEGSLSSQSQNLRLSSQRLVILGGLARALRDELGHDCIQTRASFASALYFFKCVSDVTLPARLLSPTAITQAEEAIRAVPKTAMRRAFYSSLSSTPKPIVEIGWSPLSEPELSELGDALQNPRFNRLIPLWNSVRPRLNDACWAFFDNLEAKFDERPDGG